MKQVILFLSDKSNEYILNRFKSLLQVSPDADVYFLYHQKGANIPLPIKQYPYSIFTSSVLHSIGYTPISENLVPGSNHFPLLDFYFKNQEYDYYWLVEDDVFFNGEWEVFFKYFEAFTVDFITSYVRRYVEEPNWYWWNSLSYAKKDIPLPERTHSFNPLYRLSNKALHYIHNQLCNGWIGHHEVLIASLLEQNGYSIMDMGGNGTYVMQKYKDKFYTETTWSYQPLHVQKYRSNMIYHPIKEKTGVIHKKKCVISAVGKDSLHKEWLKGNEKPDFDLHLIVYDNSFNAFYNDTDFISCKKGHKLKLVYDYLKNHPEYMKYDYFFIPDDDIQTDTDNINLIFRYMEQYHLEIAQPGLSESYYTYPHTLRDKLCLLRYTNFIEIMLPCFSNRALNAVLETFNANESGWGIEGHWPILINSTHKDIAIIDQIKMIHTRPIRSYNSNNINDLNLYKAKYNLKDSINEWGALPANQTIDLQHFAQFRASYIEVQKYLKIFVNRIVQMEHSKSYEGFGLDGILGICLLLVEYSKQTDNIAYRDIAINYLDHINDMINKLKDNLNFYDGLVGCCWSIEYLSQEGVIQENTDEIMEDVANYMNKSIKKNIPVLTQNQLVGIYCLYERKLANPFRPTNSLLRKEEQQMMLTIKQILKAENLDMIDKMKEKMLESPFLTLNYIFNTRLHKQYSEDYSLYYYLLCNAWDLLYLTKLKFKSIADFSTLNNVDVVNGFSVIMPIYNMAYFIKRAIMSLKNQTYSNWELIIINDGSTDNTEDVLHGELKDSRIRYISYQQNKGLGHALNIGLDAAHFSHIAYLPADDYYYPQHLEILKNHFELNKATVLVYSSIGYYGSDSFFICNETETNAIHQKSCLQLIQAAHKRTKDRWMERSEMVTDNLYKMFWNKLLNKGLFLPTCQISAKWTDYPYQRHKLGSENYEDNLYKYKW